MSKFKSLMKKLFHIHKYTTLSMYPPKHVVDSDAEWGFLLRCNCGHVKSPSMPSTITTVEEVHSTWGYIDKGKFKIEENFNG